MSGPANHSSNGQIEDLDGLHQKPVWITSRRLAANHFLFKSYHTCSLSEDKTDYTGFKSFGGQVYTRLSWWRRPYLGTTSPSVAKETESEWFLQSPYGRVPATTNTQDIVGPDYHQPSEDYYRKLAATINHGFAEDGTAADGVYTRVIGARHEFYFHNYSRFPLEVVAVFDPYPHTYGPTYIMDSASTGLVDVGRLGNSAEKFICQSAVDNGDRAAITRYVVNFSPKKYTPEEFSANPGNFGPTSLGGMWRLVETTNVVGAAGYSGSGITGSPWGNDSPDHGTISGTTYRTKACLAFYVRLLAPTEEVYTRNPEPVAGALGDYTALDVHVRSTLINEVVRKGYVAATFNDNETYPAEV